MHKYTKQIHFISQILNLYHKFADIFEKDYFPAI